MDTMRDLINAAIMAYAPPGYPMIVGWKPTDGFHFYRDGEEVLISFHVGRSRYLFPARTCYERQEIQARPYE